MNCDVKKTKFYFAPQCTTIDFWEGLSRSENVTDVNGTVTEELRLWGLRFFLGGRDVDGFDDHPDAYEWQ